MKTLVMGRSRHNFSRLYHYCLVQLTLITLVTQRYYFWCIFTSKIWDQKVKVLNPIKQTKNYIYKRLRLKFNWFFFCSRIDKKSKCKIKCRYKTKESNNNFTCTNNVMFSTQYPSSTQSIDNWAHPAWTKCWLNLWQWVNQTCPCMLTLSMPHFQLETITRPGLINGSFWPFQTLFKLTR